MGILILYIGYSYTSKTRTRCAKNHRCIGKTVWLAILTASCVNSINLKKYTERMSGESVACQIKTCFELSLYSINAFSLIILQNDQYKKKTNN